MNPTESGCFAQILLPFGNVENERLFTYEIPSAMNGTLSVGDPVDVPFRSATATGYIVALEEQSNRATKFIIKKHNKLSSLPSSVLAFSRWMANRYLSPWWDCVQSFSVTKIEMPPGKLQLQTQLLKARLTGEQEKAASAVNDALRAQRFKTFLLFGITGSGKTEIYLNAASKALTLGREVLVLVPEISLSFQTAKKFQEIFQNQVIVLHSGLTEKEKREQQFKLQQGIAKIVIGARMALFAPFNNLGLILMDEEHDGSYKQESHPRYHALTIAQKLAEDNQAALVLGSATPSLESFHAAQEKKIELLTLESRFEAVGLPSVKIVDMRQTNINRAIPISPELLEALRETVKKKHQAILFLNRRGFSPMVLCTDCGFVFKCPRCNITLTFHLERGLFRCHYCDYQHSTPKTCPNCQSFGLTYRGFGTQRLEEEIQKFLPGVKALRLDRDTAAKRGAMKNILESFGKGDAQILIGTQMVTKGFHFPNVNLVGIVHADQLLHFPDFRATEKTFQLITQVAGRAGRSLTEGQAILQTYDPENPAVQAASNHDYLLFYREEIENRRASLYPPFVSLANLLITGADETVVQEQTHALAKHVQEMVRAVPDSQLLGPSPCPIEKINRNYRWHLLLKAGHVDTLIELGRAAYDWHSKHASKKTRLTVDIDPRQLL